MPNLATHPTFHLPTIAPPPDFIACADASHTVYMPNSTTEGHGFFEHDLSDWEADEYTVCRAKMIGAVFYDADDQPLHFTADMLVEAFGLAWVREQEADSETQWDEENQ